MKKRVCWIASIVSALAAVFLQCAALEKANNGVHSRLFSRNVGILEIQRRSFLMEEHQFYKTAAILSYTGTAVAILSLVFLFASRYMAEPARRSIVVFLSFVEIRSSVKFFLCPSPN
jgi:hypothetical protein